MNALHVPIILSGLALFQLAAVAGRDITLAHEKLYERKNGHLHPSVDEVQRHPVREGKLDIFLQPHTHDDVGKIGVPEATVPSPRLTSSPPLRLASDPSRLL